MPRSKNNSIDKIRQAVNKSARTTISRRIKAQKNKKKAAQKQRDKEVILKARALKRLGIYMPKKNIALKNLTPAKKRIINRKFNELQKKRHYVRSKGKSYGPLSKVDYVTPKGNLKQKYELTPYFQLLRTKKKVPRKNLPRDAMKTKRGILLEKTNKSSKFRVKNGNIIERTNAGKVNRIINRKSWTGKQTLQLADAIRNGQFTLKPNQLLRMNRYGWKSSYSDFAPELLDQMPALLEEYKSQMSPDIFKGWLDVTEFTLVTEKESQ